MKKILYFYDYGQSYGGAVNTLLQQMLLIRESGYEVIAYVSNLLGNEIHEEYKEMFACNDVELKKLSYCICSHTEEIDISSVIENYHDIYDIIKSEKPDLVHSVQINPTVELVCRSLKIPHIMDIYQSNDEFFAIDYLDLFPHFHICDSKMYADSWSKGLHIDSTCIRTVVMDYKHKDKIEFHDNISFIVVGQVIPRKNQLEVIKGFKESIEQGISGTLDLYGVDNGEYAEKCKKYVEDNNLSSFIKFHGFVTDMKQIYENTDVLICGSTVESYPNAISEALANGVIVLSSPVAGVPEVIKDKENGFLCEGYGSIHFTEKIKDCWNAFQNHTIQNILCNANETFAKEHSKEIIKEKLLKYYAYVINRKNNTRLPDFEMVEGHFSRWLNIYNNHMDEISRSDLLRVKLWYWYHIHEYLLMHKEKKVYIWGTGIIGQHAYGVWKYFFTDIKLEGFIDSVKEGYFHNYYIYKPDSIMEKEDVVILVAISKFESIVEQLLAENKKYGKDYFILARRSW